MLALVISHCILCGWCNPPPSVGAEGGFQRFKEIASQALLGQGCYFLFLSSCSSDMKPADIMPAGIATIAIPTSDDTMLTIRPILVSG